MTSYVLDSSVAAKWVLPSKDEPLQVEAIQVLESFAAGECNLSVPDLFWPEIGNIIWKSARLGRISEKSAIDAIDWFQALDIPTTSTKPLMRDATTLAIGCDRSVYGSLYVALAIASGRSLLTADERLFNAVGARFPVRWLGSLL